MHDHDDSVIGITLPALFVDDCPQLAMRGFMLDVSRNKVGRLTTLWIDDSHHMACAGAET